MLRRIPHLAMTVAAAIVAGLVLVAACDPMAQLDCCTSDEECDDGLFCTGVESCVACLCRVGTAPCSDDCLEACDACGQCCEVDECDDALFCNGQESCAEHSCIAGEPPCRCRCDEEVDACAECCEDSDCDDGLYCSGVERCVDFHCVTDEPPCANTADRCCSEDLRECIATCTSDADCDDAQFCNGAEYCDGCNCQRGDPACGVGNEDCCTPYGCQCRCADDSECETGSFCRSEHCSTGGYCVRVDPCAPQLCNEQQRRCEPCTQDSQCPASFDLCRPYYCLGGECVLSFVRCGSDKTCFGGECVSDCTTDACEDDDPCTTAKCSFGHCYPHVIQCETGKRCDSTTGACGPLPETCIAQCPDDAESCCPARSLDCDPRPSAELLTFEETLDRWRQAPICFSGESEYDFRFMVAGRCADGALFTYRRDVLSVGAFYDGVTHQAFATLAQTDGGNNVGATVVPDECSGTLFWPVQYACRDAVVTEVICSRTVQVGDVIGFDPCVSACGIYLVDCRHPRLDDFPDFENQRALWEAEPFCPEVDEHVAKVAGICGDGARFLHRNDGLGTQTNYYHAEEGAFFSVTTTSDVAGALCLSRRYWPSLFLCRDAVVSGVLCGSRYHAGDPIVLP